MWLGATSAQEAAYLEHWRGRALAEERAEDEPLMQVERDEEEERCARGEAVQPAVQQV